jgi:hypothetical protein
MTLILQPPASTTDEEIQVLFKEARRRRRRRWTVGAVSLCVIAVVLAMLVGTNARTPHHPARLHIGLPRWTPLGPARPAPSDYVAGDGNGGVGVYSTATGSLVRTISPQGVGGPDVQAVLSGDRQSVFFAQPNGTCGGGILKGPVSGARAPTVAISVPQTLALEPSPSPASSNLAWVGVNCGQPGAVSTLYVTNLATGTQSNLGPFTGGNSDNGIAWSPDGKNLAVEAGSTVEVLQASRTTTDGARQMSVPIGCRLSYPTFVARPHQLAVISTCYKKASDILVFDTTTGQPIAEIAAASQGAKFQGLSVDTTGRHFLVGVVNLSGETLAQVDNSRLVTVSKRSPSGAEW